MPVVDVSHLGLEVGVKELEGLVFVPHHLGVHQVQNFLLQLRISIKLKRVQTLLTNYNVFMLTMPH
jgi:hypothetical protein